MTQGTISVSHGDIEAQAKNLAQIKNQLEQILTTAKSQVDQLRESGGFKSSAGDSFNTTYEEWTTANMKSVGLLEEMSTYLTKASAAFADIDAAYTIK
ncbi:MAG TPA: WXG100 family type VII secretion target [Marmoricola sp.]|jgi:WXG100 family type VII secretion target